MTQFFQDFEEYATAQDLTTGDWTRQWSDTDPLNWDEDQDSSEATGRGSQTTGGSQYDFLSWDDLDSPDTTDIEFLVRFTINDSAQLNCTVGARASGAGSPGGAYMAGIMFGDLVLGTSTAGASETRSPTKPACSGRAGRGHPSHRTNGGFYSVRNVNLAFQQSWIDRLVAWIADLIRTLGG